MVPADLVLSHGPGSEGCSAAVPGRQHRGRRGGVPAGHTRAQAGRLPRRDHRAGDGRVAVLEVRRTAYDNEGTPFRLTVSVYPADRNRLAVSIGEVPQPEVTSPGPA